MWASVEEPWKAAFEQGWEAFAHGSIPIGACITDGNGKIISVGRNHVFEGVYVNPRIAHAEIEAMQNLDTHKYPDVQNYTLYACMEPCPMCLGTIVMSDIRTLRIAAKDSYCGAVHFCHEDPYIASKNMQVSFEYGLLETVQLVMQTYFELKLRNGNMNVVTKAFEKSNPKAVRIAKSYYEKLYFDTCLLKAYAFGNVFNEIANDYTSTNE
jgi:tRNA(adenine34) deaminase